MKTQERVTPQWEPTEAEVEALIADYCASAGPHDPEQSYGCPEGGCADCRTAFTDELRRVGPMIAARALREAAESLRGLAVEHFGSLASYVRLGDAITRLGARAAALETPPSPTGDTK